MFYCTNTNYAKVWKVTKSDRYMDLTISTSEKDRDGNTVYSRWFARAIGHAFNAMKDTVKEGDSIQITKCKLVVDKYTDKDGIERYPTKVIIMDAQLSESSASNKSSAVAKDTAKKEEDSCPW